MKPFRSFPTAVDMVRTICTCSATTYGSTVRYVRSTEVLPYVRYVLVLYVLQEYSYVSRAKTFPWQGRDGHVIARLSFLGQARLRIYVPSETRDVNNTTPPWGIATTIPSATILIPIPTILRSVRLSATPFVMVLSGVIETPQTEAGNATYLSNGIPDFSMEPSFVEDVGHRFRGNSSRSGLVTPGARRPLMDRRNAPGRTEGVEFTPLLKSVARTTLARHTSGQNAVPPTPAVLKAGYQSTGNSPALPLDATALNGGDTESSFDQEDVGATTVPPASSSSIPPTPLATLPESDRGAVIADGRKMMTLREQENVSSRVQVYPGPVPG